MDFPPWARRAAHGTLTGLLLATLRAPLGLDWTQTAIVQGTTAALFRAAGLFLVALGSDPRRAALQKGLGPGWIAAVLLGYALQSFLLDRAPESRAGYALLCVLGVLLLRTLAGPRVEGEMQEAPGRRERVSLVGLGAGLALALESLAHETRLFTPGTVADEAWIACVFLGLVWLGALSFGPLLAKLRPASLAVAFPAALAAGLAVVGLRFLAGLSPAGLDAYLLRVNGGIELLRSLDRAVGSELGLATLPPLDGAAIGTLWVTGVLAAAALVLPAFAVGGALGAARDGARPAHLFFGAGLGLLARPHLVGLLGEPVRAGDLPGVSWWLVALGAGLAGVAMLVAAWSSQRRALTIVLALLCAGLPWLQPRLAFASLSPWSPRPVVPEFLWSTPEGLLAVEPGRGERSLVTLDRRRLTPTHDEEAADGLALETSFSLIPAEKRAGTVRTLFVGQLTPARARTLARLGQLDLERTAPWHAAMPLIEPYLFAGEGEPPGRILPPAAARARLSEGAYDWVIAAGIRGPIVSWRSEANELWSEVDAPRLTDLELPAGTVGTSWTPMNARVAQGVELGQMLVAFGALDQPAFGLARGEFGELALPLFELERWDGPCPLTQLVTLPQLRAFEFERAFSAGLVSRSSPPFARGLALHFAAQVLSSPYETRAQQIELEEEALRAFREAVPPPGALDPLTRALWEALAWLCLEKRQPEFALVYLEPVADRFRPWPALERSLARAFLEVLEPETALAYAERALVALPEDFELLIDAARAGLELGGRERAAPFLERALALEPTREDRVRTLGFLLHEAGDGRGRALLEALLQRHPEDEELLRVLASGPTPP